MTQRGESSRRAASVGRLALKLLGALTLTVVRRSSGPARPGVALSLGGEAPGAGSTPQAMLASTAAAGGAPHIMLIVEENEGYSNVIGSSSAPYLNSLAKSYASATNWYGVQHNSPHDYLDVTIGSDLNLPNGMPYSVPMVVDELHGAGHRLEGLRGEHAIELCQGLDERRLVRRESQPVPLLHQVLERVGRLVQQRKPCQ